MYEILFANFRQESDPSGFRQHVLVRFSYQQVKFIQTSDILTDQRGDRQTTWRIELWQEPCAL